FAFAAIASSPMLITFAVAFGIGPKITVLSIVALCVVSPFAEEALYRGFVFRQLYRRAKLGFWVSALIPSVLGGLGHLYQSNDPLEMAGIFGITALGFLGFSWVYTRWSENLWVPFALHMSMNLWWEVFAVDDSALGGWIANGARLATAVLAILMTI